MRENVASLRVLEKVDMRRATNYYLDLNGGAYYHVVRGDYIATEDVSLAQPDE
jgi:hypothetical protein